MKKLCRLNSAVMDAVCYNWLLVNATRLFISVHDAKPLRRLIA